MSNPARRAPVAAVISDYPIVAATFVHRLCPAYEASVVSWDEWSLEPDVSLVVADLTGVSARMILDLLAALPCGAQLVVTSLEQHDMQVYTLGSNGLVREAQGPDILALAV